MSALEALAEAYLEHDLGRLTPEGREIVMARVKRILRLLEDAGYVIVFGKS